MLPHHEEPEVECFSLAWHGWHVLHIASFSGKSLCGLIAVFYLHAEE